MTEVVVYRCPGCGLEHGPLGFHGVTRDGDGEVPAMCRACKDIHVAMVKGGEFQNRCPSCDSGLERLDGRCPVCSAPGLQFKDIRMGGDFWMDVPSR